MSNAKKAILMDQDIDIDDAVYHLLVFCKVYCIALLFFRLFFIFGVYIFWVYNVMFFTQVFATETKMYDFRGDKRCGINRNVE